MTRQPAPRSWRLFKALSILLALGALEVGLRQFDPPMAWTAGTFDGNRMRIADAGNHAVRSVLSDGTFDTVVGRGPTGYAGDGESAENASLRFPQDIAVGQDGDLLIADTNNAVIRWVANPTW